MRSACGHYPLRTMFLIATAASAVPVTATSQSIAASRRVNFTFAAGIAQPLAHAGNGADLAVRAGIRRSFGAAGLALEIGYTGLGQSLERTSSLTPFPESAPAVETHRQKLSAFDLGLTADLAVTTTHLRPAVLLGLGLSRVSTRYEMSLFDTAGQRLRFSRFVDRPTRFHYLLGTSLALPPVRATLEARYHGYPVRADDGWATIQFLTLALQFGL